MPASNSALSARIKAHLRERGVFDELRALLVADGLGCDVSPGSVETAALGALTDGSPALAVGGGGYQLQVRLHGGRAFEDGGGRLRVRVQMGGERFTTARVAAVAEPALSGWFVFSLPAEAEALLTWQVPSR